MEDNELPDPNIFDQVIEQLEAIPPEHTIGHQDGNMEVNQKMQQEEEQPKDFIPLNMEDNQEVRQEVEQAEEFIPFS
jgi:hypothetical protein